MDQILIN